MPNTDKFSAADALRIARRKLETAKAQARLWRAERDRLATVVATLADQVVVQESAPCGSS